MVVVFDFVILVGTLRLRCAAVVGETLGGLQIHVSRDRNLHGATTTFGESSTRRRKSSGVLTVFRSAAAVVRAGLVVFFARAACSTFSVVGSVMMSARAAETRRARDIFLILPLAFVG